jgi:hypothetical protein
MFGRTELADCIPTILNFSMAESRYKDTTPLTRGADKGLIPLGDNRRYKRSQLLKVDTEQGTEYRLRFWQSNLFVFRENGEVLVDVPASWNTPTTLMFMNAVSNDQFCRYKGKIYFGQKQDPVGYYRIHGDEPLVLKDWKAINPKPEFAYTLNKQRMKELRAKYKPFLTYCKNVFGVQPNMDGSQLKVEWGKIIQNYGEEFVMDFARKDYQGQLKASMLPQVTVSTKEMRWRPELQEIRYKYLKRVEEACKDNDLDSFYPYYFMLFVNSAQSTWTGSGGYVHTVDFQGMNKYFNELLKFNSPDLFDRKEQPLGLLVADSNAKYFLK